MPPSIMATNPIAQLKALQEKLQAEREERKKIEDQACQLVRKYKQKYADALQEKTKIIDTLKIEIDQEKEKQRNLEDDKQNLEDKLQSLQDQLKQLESSKRSRSRSPRGGDRTRSNSGRRSCGSGDGEAVLKAEITKLNEEIAGLKESLEVKSLEVSRSKERFTFTREINIELRGKNTALEKEVKSLTEKLEKAQEEADKKFKDEISSLTKNVKDLERKLKEGERDRKQLIDNTKTLKTIIETKDKKIDAQCSEIDQLKNTCENYRKEKAAEIEREKEQLVKEMKDLKDNLKKKSSELMKQSKTAECLKIACTEIEKQTEDYERVLAMKEKERQKLKDDLDQARAERDSLSRDLKRLQESLMTDKTRTDTVVIKLREKIEDLESDLAQEHEQVVILENQLDNEREISSQHLSKIQELQNELDYATLIASETDERANDLEHQIREIKEEAARNITQFVNEKNKCTKLKRALEEANEKIEIYQGKIESLILKMEREKKAYEDDIFGLQERIRQHREAEKEMLARIEKLETKKKPYFGKSPLISFGSNTPVTTKVRDVRTEYEASAALENERRAKKELEEKLRKTQTELFDLKIKLKMTRVNDFEGDETSYTSAATNASAPPPPYDDDGQSDSDSHSVASSSDNNNADEIDGGRRRSTVYADIHERVDGPSHSGDRNKQDFSFSESTLELLTAGQNKRNN